MSSYTFTKQFIDRQIKTLNTPLAYNKDIRDTIEATGGDSESLESKIKSVIFKCNILVKRHNRNVFLSQIINQIVQQVLKCEMAKLVKVNETFVKLTTVLKPILVPDFDLTDDFASQLKEFSLLVNELPSLKYLLVEESDQVQHQDSVLEESPGLVVDDEERTKRYNKKQLEAEYQEKLQKSIAKSLKNIKKDIEQTLEKYETIRLRLVKINETLCYKYNKLLYLQQLKQKLISSFDLSAPATTTTDLAYDSDECTHEDNFDRIDSIQSNLVTSTRMRQDNNLFNEINRFKVLVEKISYKLQKTDKNEFKETIHRINQDLQ